MLKKLNYLFLFASIGMLGQNISEMDFSGVYKLPSSSPEGGQTVIINEDGTFTTFFFGGGLKGTWKQTKNTIQFEIIKKPAFVVYARKTKSLIDSTRLEFTGFSQNPTFVNLSANIQKDFLRVFNENANCFSPPYIHKTKTKLSNVAFAKYNYRDKLYEIHTFDLPDHYNDFLAINLSDTYTQDYNFKAELKEGLLYFDNNTKPARKGPMPSGEDAAFIKEFMRKPFFPDRLTSKEEFFPIYDQPTDEDLKPFLKINTLKIYNALIDVLNNHLFTAKCE